jgi:hypothetical protein
MRWLQVREQEIIDTLLCEEHKNTHRASLDLIVRNRYRPVLGRGPARPNACRLFACSPQISVNLLWPGYYKLVLTDLGL